MEVHSVLPEERARDVNGEFLPWGYRYADTSRNARQPAEESGPFGSKRSTRYTGSRTSRTRTATTPARQKENPAVVEFGKLFAKEQAREEEAQSKRAIPAPNTNASDLPQTLAEPEAVATECLLYGYASKASEWKVLSKFEKIVTPSFICEDYPREDPDLFLSSNSPYAYSKSAIVVHKNLSRDALRKARVYKGGNHWIKITFDNLQAAEKACYYSPIEIDGHMVFCEMWQGKGPFSDAPLLKGSHSANELQRNTNAKMRTLTTSQSTNFLSGKDSALAGFEQALRSQTLPRSHTLPHLQFAQQMTQDDSSITSTTASSATATEPLAPPQSGLRSRSQPNLPTTPTHSAIGPLTHIPSAKRLVLRPISEALAPQPSFTTKVLRSLPIVSWFVGSANQPANESSGLLGDGPALKEDGTWDSSKNGIYWSFWHFIDALVGSDFCGLKDD